MVTYADHSSVTQPASRQRAAGPVRSGTAVWRRRLIVVFVFLFALPIEPILADLLLSGPRLFVLFTFVPFLLMTLAGKGGGLTFTDVMMVGLGVWVVVSFLYLYGLEQAPFAMITTVELLGGYLAGRVLVRSAEDYRWFFNAYFVMLLILLPFAIFEMMTGRPLLSEAFSLIMRVTPQNSELRNGVYRAGVSYPHPILWGLVASLLLAQAWLIWKDDKKARLVRAGVAIGCTITAMSSAPLLGLGTQVALILWGRITGNRWLLLTGLFAAAILALDLLSNRGPVILMIETMTLNSDTAWWRVYIWQFGSQSVMNNPLFGIGLADWERPYWLTGSVDNFWLLIAMRHGIPAIACLALGLLWGLWKTIRMRDISDADKTVRQSYVIGLVAVCFALSTVHAWGAPAVLVMFYFGMSAFLYTGGARPAQETEAVDPAGQTGPRKHLPFSRFRHGDGPVAVTEALPSAGRRVMPGKASRRPARKEQMI